MFSWSVIFSESEICYFLDLIFLWGAELFLLGLEILTNFISDYAWSIGDKFDLDLIFLDFFALTNYPLSSL